MRVALVHDYLREYGGAERVLEALHNFWPDAPIYTLVYLPQSLGSHREKIKSWDIRPLIPQWIPFISKAVSSLRLLAPFMFSRLDLSVYDLVLVSATGAYIPNLIKTKAGVHFCYCHTPPRYLYGLPTAREWKKHWWVRIPAEVANHFLRLADFKSAQRVDFFMTNSKNTASRIEKFYRRKATVIYPPVKTGFKVRGLEIREKPYFLTGGRLARAKRIDLAVKACTELKLPLKVFGRMFAGYGQELKQMAGPTVEFLGEVTDEELAKLYAGCLAFIFPAEEEDFGIAPVEAMFFGKPVIALRSGGVVESVTEDKTGEFFEQPTVESLMKVLKIFESAKYQPLNCKNQARKFSKERFEKGIEGFIKEKYGRKGG